MKLNEISTDKALDVLCDLTPYVSEIAEDKKLIKLITSKIKLDKDADTEKIKEKVVTDWVKKAKDLIPMLLKSHRDSIYNIVAIINEKTVEEVASQKVTITIREIKETLMDNDFLDFFQELLK